MKKGLHNLGKNNNKKSRVVVTGMGTINPVGNTVESTWEKIIKGESGVGRISSFDTSNLRVQIVCEVKGFNTEDHLSSKEIRRRDRDPLFASAAAKNAKDAFYITVPL